MWAISIDVSDIMQSYCVMTLVTGHTLVTWSHMSHVNILHQYIIH